MSKKILHIGLAEKLHTHSLCSLSHLHRNRRILLTEICMTLSGIYDHKSASHILKGKGDLLAADILLIREIQQNRAAGSACHLVHQTGSFFPVNILRILAGPRILAVLQFSFVEEVVGNCAYQHLKRCRRAYTGSCNNLCGNISIKTTCRIAFLLHIFHDTCDKSIGTFCISFCAEFVKVYNYFLSVTFTDHMDHISSVWISCTDGVQIDTCSNNLSAVMVNMVANDLCTSRSSKKLSLVVMIFLLEIHCKVCITSTALLCLTIDFFQHFCCWNFDRSHFRILLFFMLIRAFSGIVLPAARFSYIRPPPEPSPLISGDLSRHVFCTFIITALSLLSIKILCKNRIILWSARYWLSFSLSVKIYPDRSRYPNGGLTGSRHFYERRPHLCRSSQITREKN